jgi:hypothetical protein
VTLVGVVLAGFLIWIGGRIYDFANFGHRDKYWAYVGLLALAGLVMALSQLLGGWTKWGWPRLSGKVLMFAFLPTLILGGWVLAAYEPGGHWLGRNVQDWSEDIHIHSVLTRFAISTPAIAFAIGLVFGFSLDTTGPRVKRSATPEEKPSEDAPAEPEPEPAPRTGQPTQE